MIIVILIDTYEKGHHCVPLTAQRVNQILTDAGHTTRIVGLGQSKTPYKLRSRHIPLYSTLGKIRGIRYAKTNTLTLEKAIEGADMVHAFLPFSLEKKGEWVARLKEVPILTSCAMDAKGFQKLSGLGWFSSFAPVTWQFLQFSYFQKFKNILCHNPEIYRELERNGFPQKLHCVDFDKDSDDVLLRKILLAYDCAKKDDLLTYQDKSRQIFQRNWAVMPSSIDLAEPYAESRLPGRVFHNICYGLGVSLFAAVNFTYYGLRIKGHRNIAAFKGGAFTVSNHLHNVDATMLAASLFPRHVTFTSIEGNFRLPLIRWLIKWVGVVPIPKTTKALGSFFEKTVDFAKNGHIIHFYPEGSLWQYSKTLRPFKKGAFHMAIDAGVPIIPVVLAQRPPKGLYRLFRKKSLFTTLVLQAVYPNDHLEGPEQVSELKTRVHAVMQEALTAHHKKYK